MMRTHTLWAAAGLFSGSLLCVSTAAADDQADKPIPEKKQTKLLEQFGEDGIDADGDGIPDDCENTWEPVGDCSADPDCCCVTNRFKPLCRPWDNVCVLCYDDSHCGSNCCCMANGSCFCGPFACGQFLQGP